MRRLLRVSSLALVVALLALPGQALLAADKPVGKVDLNTADAKTLESLPGIGSATAKAIIAARPFKSVDDLKNVKGIGDSKFAALKDKVTVGAAPAAAPAAPAAAPAAPAAPAAKAPAAAKAAPAAAAPAAPAAPAAAPAAAAPAAKAAAKAPAAKLAPGQKVNINTATKEQLDMIPEIGAVKAQAIIDGRPYQKVEDIMKVKGIKEATFAKIKDFITVN